MAGTVTIKTLQDIINISDRFDINKITFFTTTEDGSIIVPDTNLFEIYRRYINPYITSYSVTEAQREYYKYRPYLLSKDIYGTPELGWLILMLNDQECASKFRLKSSVRLIPANVLEQVYDTIVTKSSDKLNQNWNTYLPMAETRYQ